MGYTSVDVRSISDSEKDKPCHKAGDILISGLTLPLSVRAQIIAIKFSIKWLSETSDRKMCKGGARDVTFEEEKYHQYADKAGRTHI